MDRDRARRVAYALVAMSRPSQLLLIAAVYALGAAAALARGAGPADPDVLLGGLGGIVPLAASVHYANEYADHGTDRLTDPTPFSGGSQALVRTGLGPGLALRAAQGALAVGVAVTAVCLFRGHLATAAAWTLGGITVVGWAYSVPPAALAWRGLGEVTNAALGGLALPAYGYAVVAGGIGPGALAAFVPFACLVFLNLLETQWPDREADAAVGKRTLATRWSPRRLRGAYAAGVVAAAGSLAALAVVGRLPAAVAAATLPALPLVAWGYRRYTRRERPLPAVLAMVLVAVGQLLAWTALAWGRGIP